MSPPASTHQDIVHRRIPETGSLKSTEFERDMSTVGLGHTHDHLSHDEQLLKLKEVGAATPIASSQIGTDFNYKRQIVWKNAIGFLALHLCALYGVYLTFAGISQHKTTIYSLTLIYGSGLGVTMGAHRLWSHRSFKATLPLKVFLLWLHTLAGQNCLYVWVRDHRQHHKYSDTDADPHNANRGFFFSHVGWLMSRKHPKVVEFGKKIDMSDLEADAWIMFQKRHYKLLYTIFALLLPTSIPVYFWNESKMVALFTCFFARAVLQLNGTWLVNSAAHLYGTRPFDKSIFPVESFIVAMFAVGEGWHNYHHAFPWDYRASELGSPLNLTGFLIDQLAKIGLVYDRKEATHNMIKNRVMRTGDHSHHVYGTDEGRNAFKTLFNFWRHPTNPTFNSLHSPKPKVINSAGYALIQDELNKNELDETILSKENEALEKKLNEDVKAAEPALQKFIVEKSSNCKIMTTISKFIDNSGTILKECVSMEFNNNNDAMSYNRSGMPKDKSELNINVDDVLLVKL